MENAATSEKRTGPGAGRWLSHLLLANALLIKSQVSAWVTNETQAHHYEVLYVFLITSEINTGTSES